jgi:transposase
MTQGIDNIWQAEARTQETKQLIRDIKRITRRKFTAEEKIRIVLEGFRRDTPIRDLCRREGIKPSTYYAWLKDFVEAGKEGLTRDITRDATRTEIQKIKRENAKKHVLPVAEASGGGQVTGQEGRLIYTLEQAEA